MAEVNINKLKDGWFSWGLSRKTWSMWEQEAYYLFRKTIQIDLKTALGEGTINCGEMNCLWFLLRVAIERGVTKLQIS